MQRHQRLELLVKQFEHNTKSCHLGQRIFSTKTKTFVPLSLVFHKSHIAFD